MSQVAQALLEGSPNEFEELQRECTGYAEVTRAETETRLRLMKELKPVLERLKHPVSLDLRVRGLFPEAIKLSVGSDFSLKATYSRGRADSIPLLSLEDAFVEVMNAVATKVEADLDERRRRELARARPKLRAELMVEKKRVPIFGRWKYRLVVFNLGADACSIAMTARCGDSERLFGGFDIPKGDSVDFDLRDSRTISRSQAVSVDVACSDSRGVPYTGTVQISQKGGYKSIQLKGSFEPDGSPDRPGT